MEEYQEIEVKFFVRGFERVAKRLSELDANLVQPRVHEYNLRFDTPKGELTQELQVLRLRRDTENRLTYKGPGILIDGVRFRKEIEFSVSDFNRAKTFLEALGYQVSWIYEKYRTMYILDDVHVTLDEMPFGNFLEVEGADISSIKAVCQKLGLYWDARIADSYAMLFQAVCRNLGLEIDNLTFAEFAGIEVLSNHLGVIDADF